MSSSLKPLVPARLAKSHQDTSHQDTKHRQDTKHHQDSWREGLLRLGLLPPPAPPMRADQQYPTRHFHGELDPAAALEQAFTQENIYCQINSLTIR